MDDAPLPHKDESRFFRRGPIFTGMFAALVLWSGMVAYSLFWNISNLDQEKVTLATAEARSIWNKDYAFREWASRHGGVYVPPDERTPPNPNLAHLPDRDVVTTDGKRLTLMNPAYMMRQMTEEFEESYGIKGKITGKVQINPDNAPDPWERKALDAFEQGVKEVVELSEIDGEPYLRFMKPMFMTKGCEKCHGYLGFRDGDLRGGISVSIPMTPYLAAATDTARTMKVTHGLVWLLGVLGILTFTGFALHRHRERRQLLDRLEHDALHDELTGLPNRMLFTDRLAMAIERKRRDWRYGYAVGFVDLDRFKNINDSYGHQTGDRMLVQVAQRFREVIRPTDTVARLGGDEFTFLIEGFDDEGEAVVVAERILESLSAGFELPAGTLYTSASLGLCFGSRHYRTPEELIRDADTAMYQAKEGGRGRIHVFNPELHRRAMELMRIENDLRGALAAGQFELHYQPIVDLGQDRIAGFEALLRWQHPELGAVPPDRFIPVAEETGLILPIGEWVLERATRQVAEWNRRYGTDCFVSVNLSGQQLAQDGLEAIIDRALDAAKLPAGQLHCEITETILIRHRLQAARVLERLRERGVRISLDDFGKGYCSLTYLHEFHVDHIKIDKEFVQDMDGPGKGLALVRAIMLLARDFEAKVIAEGVETPEQLAQLQALDCPWVQGFHLHRPAPPETVDAWLVEAEPRSRTADA